MFELFSITSCNSLFSTVKKKKILTVDICIYTQFKETYITKANKDIPVNVHVYIKTHTHKAQRFYILHFYLT